MPSNIIAVEPKGDKAAILIVEGGGRVWTPDRTKTEGLVGGPIPDTWTQKIGEYGPQAFPPREGKPGGKPAWANTEEGEKYVQERMDRRTALMQAVAILNGPVGTGDFSLEETVDWWYQWLRKNLDVSAPRDRSEASRPADGGAEQSGLRHSAEGSQRVGADTPLDGGGGTEYGTPQGKPPSASGKLEDSPPPSSTTFHSDKWQPCHCGAEWGPNTTATGKRVCIKGHVEKFDG